MCSGCGCYGCPFCFVLSDLVLLTLFYYTCSFIFRLLLFCFVLSRAWFVLSALFTTTTTLATASYCVSVFVFDMLLTLLTVLFQLDYIMLRTSILTLLSVFVEDVVDVSLFLFLSSWLIRFVTWSVKFIGSLCNALLNILVALAAALARDVCYYFYYENFY